MKNSTPSPQPPASHYRSYLVRLWRDSQHGTWRAAARHVLTGEEVMFKDVEGLVEFLRKVVKEEDR